MSRTRPVEPALHHVDGSPVRVLAVDDEPSITELVAMALRYEGWDVRTAGTGTDAVHQAREFRPDAIVLDMMLPDLDGLEVMRRVRSENPDVPVIFLTARDAVADRVAGLTAGGDDYVTKPFSLEELVTRVRSLLRVRPSDVQIGSEVVELSDTMNAMFDHVESALAAREASESQVRTFVADASHELRNPLASIRGYAELTRRGRDSLPDDIALALTRIDSEAARMSALVEDMLFLARLDAGKAGAVGGAERRSTEVQLERIDLCEVAINAIRDARAAGPDHHWRLHLPADSVWARADPDRLHQVVVNLLANARVHTPAGTTVELPGRSRS